MKNTILVAGGTGDVGGRIIKALVKRQASVLAIVRQGSDKSKVDELEKSGVKVIHVDTKNVAELTAACQGISCIVSAVAGLRETIVDAQSLLLDAAVAAGVPRFIPSDYSVDFTTIPEGENRNFDLRREFHQRLKTASVKSTSIMNGAFAEILAYNTPFYNLKDNTVGYWGNDPDFRVSFTTKDDAANYTAAAALDATTPEILHIASFQISPNEMVKIGSDIKKVPFKLIPMGSLEDLSAYNKKERAAHPEGENELYPAWQSSQYMHSMFSVQTKDLDNDLYPDIKWATSYGVLSGF